MIDASIREELKSIVGAKCFFDHKESLISYSYDAFTFEGMPEAVLFPTSTEEVSRIMRVASREKIPVTARGCGTNLTGGSVPARPTTRRSRE